MRIVCCLLGLTLAIGCAHDKKPSQKEVATQHWNRTRANVLHGLAKDQYTAGNLDKSRQTVAEALSLDPQNGPLRILSARLYIEKNELPQADTELKLARQIDPKNAEADYLSGLICQRWQQPAQAYEHYKAAREKAPDELPHVLAESEMLVIMDRADEALLLLQDKLPSFQHSPAIRDSIGQLLIKAGRYREAVDMLRQASILATDDLTIREHLALALYFNKQHREAADAITRLIKQPGYSQRADLFAALGESQLQIGDARAARESLENAVQYNSSSANIWLSHAKACMQLGDLKRCESSVRQAVSLDRSSSDAQLMLGYLRLRQDRLPEALSAFRKSSALSPGDTVSLCMVGYVLEKTGQREQAVQYYGQALRINPDDDMAAKLMARIE